MLQISTLLIRSTSYLCLALIVLFSGLYAMFGSKFAEINLQLSFLNFPIFVGEILIIFCFIITAAHLFMGPVGWRVGRAWRIWVLLYCVWLLIKTVEGYWTGGAYALRNSALFYYPVFVIFVEHFLRKGPLSLSKRVRVGAILVILVMSFYAQVMNAQYSLFMVALCLALGIEHKMLRWASILLIALYSLSRIELLSGGRASLVGVVAGILFLIWYAGSLLRVSWEKQLVVVALVVLVFFFNIWIRGDRNTVLSIIPSGSLAERYSFYQNQLREKRKSFISSPIQVKVFNREPVGIEQENMSDVNRADISSMPSLEPSVASTSGISGPDDTPRLGSVQPVLPSSNHAQSLGEQKDIFEKESVPTVITVPSNPQYKPSRDVGVADINTIFRIFIWKDMLKELWRHHPLMGFSFGRPQRSESLEILRWAESEWGRDGWITPHNVFLHLIYRGGIVGLLMIGCIVGLIVSLIKDFMAVRSWPGILLVSGLISWIVIAQFGVILELPYNAIPFWVLFGFTWSYRNRLKEMKG